MIMEVNKIITGDTLEVLKTWPDNFIDCCITSPPYWGLRDYGVEGQLGLEKTPEEYVAKMVEVFREVKRVLKKEGTCWLNLGDSYNGSGGNHKPEHKNDSGFQGKVGPRCGGVIKNISSIKHKDLVGIPWRVSFALQADGWYLRQDIIWHKPNPMPESVTDRCTKSHEYIFLLAKSPKYYFNNEAIKEKGVCDKPAGNKKSMNSGRVGKEGWKFNSEKSIPEFRNKRSVWTITTKPFKEAHFATFPEDLVRPMILAGCPKGGIVLDPFMGAGTTGLVAKKLGREYLGIELNTKYVEIANKRIGGIPELLL